MARRAGSLFYYGYTIIAAAFLAQFVSIGLISYVAGAFMLPMTGELDWSRGDFALARSIGQVVMAMTGFVIGAYVDRLGGRRLMLIGTVVLGFALAMHSQVNTLWQWIALNGIAMTLGCALIGNLVVNVTLAKWFVERRGQAVAWAAMGVSLGGVVLTPWITWVIDLVGWREAWLWLAAGTVLITAPVALLMRRAPEDYGLHPDGKSDAAVAAGMAERAREDFERSMTRGQAIRTGSFYALIIAFGFFQINILVVLLRSLPYLQDAGFTRTEAALSMTVASVPAMLSKPVWGYFIDNAQPKPLAAASALVTGLALFGVVYSVEMQSLWGSYAAFFVLGLGWGGMIPLQEVIWASFFGRRYLGAVRSAALPYTLILGATAPWAVALYHDQVGTYTGGLLVVAALNVMSGFLIMQVRPPAVGSRPAVS